MKSTLALCLILFFAATTNAVTYWTIKSSQDTWASRGMTGTAPDPCVKNGNNATLAAFFSGNQFFNLTTESEVQFDIQNFDKCTSFVSVELRLHACGTGFNPASNIRFFVAASLFNELTASWSNSAPACPNWPGRSTFLGTSVASGTTISKMVTSAAQSAFNTGSPLPITVAAPYDLVNGVYVPPANYNGDQFCGKEAGSALAPELIIGCP